MVVLLLSVVLGSVYDTIASTTKAVSGTDLRLQNLDEARAVMNTLTKDLRTASVPAVSGNPSFSAASGRGATFSSSLNAAPSPYNQPSIIQINVDASSRLVETVTPCAWSGGACRYTSSQVRIVGSYVTPDPFLQFSDASGTCLNCTSPYTVAAPNLPNIASVTVSLQIKKSTSLSAKSTLLTNTVFLPNLSG